MVQPIKIKTSTPLNKAKQFPITSLYKGILKPTGQTLTGLCPLHEDHNPSFAIYPRTNTWCCFSKCGSGDVIDFYQKLYNVDFKTALEELSK